MKVEYGIDIAGCDDNTAFNMELTEEELKLVKKISEKSKEVSTYGCMPTLTVGERFEFLDDDEDDCFSRM